MKITLDLSGQDAAHIADALIRQAQLNAEGSEQRRVLKFLAAQFAAAVRDAGSTAADDGCATAAYTTIDGTAIEVFAAHLHNARTSLLAADRWMTDPRLTVRVLAPQLATALAAVDTAQVLCSGDQHRIREAERV